MLYQDINELRIHAKALFNGELASVPLFLADVDHEEPDEVNIWCSFTVNPDINVVNTLGNNPTYEQLGIAVLRISQPKDVLLNEGQLDAWEIAEVAMNHFRSFTGSDNRVTVRRFIPQRRNSDNSLIVDLLIYYRSRHTS